MVYAVNILVATMLVGMGKFFILTQVGAWGLETEIIYIIAGFCIMFLGAGKYSVSGKNDESFLIEES